jgi:hypothetical protein
MAILNSFSVDQIIKDDDLFLGTKSSNRKTVNYTAQTVADYLNVNNKISVNSQTSWKFVTSDKTTGTISFLAGGGEGTLFSDVTEFVISIVDNSLKNTVVFLDYLVGSEIILIQANTADSFGHYKITSYTISSETGFYNLVLSFIGGNGFLVDNAIYSMSSFNLGLIPGSNDYIQNQIASAQVANMYISGEAKVSTLTALTRINTENVVFNTAPTSIPTSVGSMVWNNTDGTLDLKLKGGNVTLQMGQETVTMVVNKTATNITLLEQNYQAVRITGAQGQRLKVDLAQANNDANSATTIGLVTETIANNAEGFINTGGCVKEINTTGSLQGESWNDGDVLYLSGTVAGRITNIKPIAPIHTIIIGFVEYAHAVHGKIFVKVDNGYELDELHNVSIIDPLNNDLLQYNQSTGLWKNASLINSISPYKLLASDDEGKLISINNEVNIRRYGYTVSHEFLNSGGNGSYFPQPASAGIVTVPGANIINADHPGVLLINSSVTANSGYSYSLVASGPVVYDVVLCEGLQSDLVFRTTTNDAGITIRFGVMVGTITSIDATSGFYFEINGDSLVGKTAAASVRSSTTAYTLSNTTWYHIRVKATTVSLITYTVYDMNGNTLFEETLNTNLPNTNTYLDSKVVATNSGTAILPLIHLDLISITFPRMNRGALI